MRNGRPPRRSSGASGPPIRRSSTRGWDSIGVGEHECARRPPLLDAGAAGDGAADLGARRHEPGAARRVGHPGRMELRPATATGPTRARSAASRPSSSAPRSAPRPPPTRPLWVKMRGGGAGWFDTDGTPQPTAGVKSEESLTQQLKYDTPGLMAEREGRARRASGSSSCRCAATTSTPAATATTRTTPTPPRTAQPARRRG